MRQEEVVQLKKSAVDVDARQLTLTKTKANKVRPVYLNDDALAVLKEAMALSPGEHVFATRKGTPYTQDGVRAIFRRPRDRAGVEDFRFHDLRHTTATRLRRAGAGLDVVADVLGRATLTIARRYAHLGKETMRAAMAALPSPVAPVAPLSRRKRGQSARRPRPRRSLRRDRRKGETPGPTIGRPRSRLAGVPRAPRRAMLDPMSSGPNTKPRERVLVPHPDDEADVRAGLEEAERGDVLSAEESAEYIQSLLGDARPDQ